MIMRKDKDKKDIELIKAFLNRKILIYEDGYESLVMRGYRLAVVRRSVLNLCSLYVSSDIFASWL